jgi:hypothetical protein
MCRILFILIILSINTNAYELKNVKIDSRGFAYLFFDSIPNYTTTLSTDKKRIDISAPNTDVVENSKQTHSSGLITDIYSNVQNDSLFIKINLNSSSGYNTIPQFFSKAIRVDVFSWNELTTAEDQFRTAMLGYEEEMIKLTADGLKLALKDSIVDAAAYLGFIFLKEGKINSAIKFLENADKNKSTVFDIYGALWQAYLIKGDSSNALKYLNIFKRKANLENVTKIKIDTLLEKGEQVFEDTSILFLEKKIELTESDSILNKKFEKVFESPDSVISSETLNSFSFPWWFEYLIWVTIAIVILVLFFYLRWRQKQLQLRANKKNTKKGQFQKIYKKESEQNISNKNKIQDKYNQNNNIEKDDNNEEELISEKAKDNVEKVENEVIDKAIEAIKKKKEEQETSINKNITKKDAKLQLAMQLADEQNKIRSNDLENLNKNIKNADPDKLGKIAKKLGIEKGIDESKTNFDQIKSDKDTLNKLAQKFGKK